MALPKSVDRATCPGRTV